MGEVNCSMDVLGSPVLQMGGGSTGPGVTLRMAEAPAPR